MWGKVQRRKGYKEMKYKYKEIQQDNEKAMWRKVQRRKGYKEMKYKYKEIQKDNEKAMWRKVQRRKGYWATCDYQTWPVLMGLPHCNPSSRKSINILRFSFHWSNQLIQIQLWSIMEYVANTTLELPFVNIL